MCQRVKTSHECKWVTYLTSVDKGKDYWNSKTYLTQPIVKIADLVDPFVKQQSLDVKIQSFCKKYFLKIICKSNCSLLTNIGYL